MKIALDVMGGDHGIPPNVEGAIDACRKWPDIEVVLVGDEPLIKEEIGKHKLTGKLPLSIRHASQTVDMHESPVEACRSKPDASIMVCAKLLSDGLVDGLVSAGNSGATMTASLFHLKRIEGISRPAISTILPTISGHCVMLDMGANVDCKPKHLLQFAVMGSVYYHIMFKKQRPTVGLLSIGEEEGKGNELTIETHGLLKNSGLNYIGNVEGRDIAMGKVDVIVCDGFVGNIVLKFAEGFANALLKLIRGEIKKRPLAILGSFLMHGVFSSIKTKVDPHEYGGAPLLGVKGISIVCHGGSNAYAIKNAIREAGDLIQDNINGQIHTQLLAISQQIVLA